MADENKEIEKTLRNNHVRQACNCIKYSPFIWIG
jgi:hypothetical protein